MSHSDFQGRLVDFNLNPLNQTLTLQILKERRVSSLTLTPFSDTKKLSQLQKGDIVSVDTILNDFKILTSTQSSKPFEWSDSLLDPERLRGTQMRVRVESFIREYFLSQSFIETRTPLLVESPGMEIHIKPFQTKQGPYLPTSPEFAMKKLLVGGLEKIFQICPAFRYEPHSTTHLTEFTMLEYYLAYQDELDLMKVTEKLFEHIALKLHGSTKFKSQGLVLNVETPWPRLKVNDLFVSHAGFSLTHKGQYLSQKQMFDHATRLGLKPQLADTWDDLYFRIWMNVIEPQLPLDQAVFVCDFPASQSALAVKKKDEEGCEWARRFEIYAAGLELGNAFYELTNPTEQRERFIKDMEERKQIYGADFPPSPIDESFIEALKQGLPPSSGIAIGVDRLIMLYGDIKEISKTFWLV